MEVKIKDNNGYVDADWTIENGIMVVSPKVEKFEPKDGDVVTYLNDDKPTIYVYKDGKYNTSFYVAYSSIRKQCFFNKGGYLDMNRSDIRPSTEEEMQKLFDKLKEEGLAWDAKRKEVVKINWRPKLGERYYCPCYEYFNFHCDWHYWVNDEIDNAVYNKGMVFKTDKECQAIVDKLNKALEGIKP